LFLSEWRQFDPNYVSRKFRQLLTQKNLPKLKFHGLRHSSASVLINMGFTLKEVQEWLGHADIASTEIYAHLLYKSKESMADRIGKALFADSGENPQKQAVYTTLPLKAATRLSLRTRFPQKTHRSAS
jgi:3-polyprenyl-4-hydroxybenzoate decarboxylase